LLRANISVLKLAKTNQMSHELAGAVKWRRLWMSLAVLAAASPLGLLAPGTAWGEWGTEELSRMGLAYIPAGLAKLSTLWSAPMPGYDIPFLNHVSTSYILAACAGILITLLVVWLLTTLITTRKKTETEIISK
jgi:hypothetical protein